MTYDPQPLGTPPGRVPDADGSALGRRARLAALAGYRRLPRTLQRLVSGWTTPSYQVGASLAVQRDDGAVLLVRHSYRRGWGLPGGLVKRHEDPPTAALREALEEVGIEAAIDGVPEVVFETSSRQVDVVFRARLAGPEAQEVYPHSAEILEVRWFQPDDLPLMQRDAVRMLVAANLVSGPPPPMRPSQWRSGRP